MRLHFNVAEDSITKDTVYGKDILQEGKSFPVLNIGTGSYIEDAFAECVFDEKLLYSLQVGRYSSIAHDVTFIIDMNHDYKRVSQGRLTPGILTRPTLLLRKGQIVIMNDCWIGAHATVLSGVTIANGAVVAADAVVTKDVPPYAVVAGNPARVIGYRFEQHQIDALNTIRWWNWSKKEIEKNAALLTGDADSFIGSYIERAKEDLSGVVPADIKPIEKYNKGERKRLLYIPDFEQDYPTWPSVISGFIKSYADTNYELLLYIEEDGLAQEKLNLLEEYLCQYEAVNCYINIFFGRETDMRSLFCCVDTYITNRSIDNVMYMDCADLYGVPVISGINFPVFSETHIQKMISENYNSIGQGNGGLYG